MNAMIESDYQIERDEADIATHGNYGCFPSRGEVAACAPGFTYLPDYWWSRFPAKVDPTWNIVKVFDPMSWLLIFLSILFVSMIFFITARIGTRHFGIRTFYEEIILSPIRYINLTNKLNNIERFLFQSPFDKQSGSTTQFWLCLQYDSITLVCLWRIHPAHVRIYLFHHADETNL